MKNSLKVLMVAGSVLLAAMSLAQGGGQRMMFGGGGGDSMLLGSPDVQKDLKMTEAQIKDVKAIQDAQRQEMMDMFQGGGGGGDREEMMKQVQGMMKKSDEKIKAVLTADQNKRLKQIGIQNAGGRALYREDVQKDLGLTATQRKALMDQQTKAQEAMMGMFQDFQNMSQEERRAAMEKNNKSQSEEALKVLTAEQKTAFEAMKGPKFEGKIQMGGRPGGGGGN